MSLPTGNDVQPVDPILTNMLVGYMQSDDRFVADRVFPAVPVEKDSGTYFVMSKKYWFMDEMKPRAYGAPFARGGVGVETATFATLQYALAYPIADEVRANSQLPMDLESAALRWLAQQSLIRKERAFAADFMVNNVWGTSDNNSATDWDDYTSGDPVANILTAKRTISNNTGYDPNTLVLGYIVHEAIVNHPDVIDRIKYTQAATMASLEGAVAAVLGISNYMVGKASYNSANENAAGTYAAIIDDDALLCHVDPSAGIMGATAGKTFVWQPGGGAGQIYRFRADREHADEIQMKMQWDQKVTASDLGYIWLDIV